MLGDPLIAAGPRWTALGVSHVSASEVSLRGNQPLS